jgi:hypothetical protein
MKFWEKKPLYVNNIWLKYQGQNINQKKDISVGKNGGKPFHCYQL